MGENPQKIADFTNQMAKSYIDDYLKSKSFAAELTAEFIDTRAEQIKTKLVEAETKMENFRINKNVLNTKQELDIGLKKISQLEVQLSNLSMKKITMDSLSKYVKKESSEYQKYAPSFESYGGLLFVELMKNYQSLLNEKQRLLNEFTIESKVVKDVDYQLSQTKGYVTQSIANHQELVEYQHKLLMKSIEEEKHKFDNIPQKERNYLVLMSCLLYTSDAADD